jgi:PilZ domain
VIPSLSSKRERRRWKREWLNRSVRVLTPTVEIHGFGIKISKGGMYLFALADLPVGFQVTIEYQQPRSNELVRVPGTIRHRAVYLYGLEFVRSEAVALG